MEFHEYMVFEWEINGELLYFCYVCLPFGYLDAPRICKRIFYPLVRRWRSEFNIPIVLFFDDGAFAARNEKELKMISDRIKSDLVNSHVLINPEKSNVEGGDVDTFLGHVWDLKSKVVKITDKRVAKLLAHCSHLLKVWPVVTAKEVARVVGSVISMSLVLEENSMFMTRGLQSVVNWREVIGCGWSKKFDARNSVLAEIAEQEVQFWIRSIEKLNSRPFEMKKLDSKYLTLVYGDTGAEALGGFVESGGAPIEFHDTFSSEERTTSSTERELKTLELCIDSLPELLKNKTIVYDTDLMSLHIIMGKGSTKPNLHKIAFACRQKALNMNLRIHTAWISRNHNEYADQISKTLDNSDWGISVKFFEKMEKLCHWTFSLDAFADINNYKVSKFFSRWIVPGSAGLDGLGQDWHGETVWMVPPLFLLPASLNHLERCHSRGMLVFPAMKVHIINPLLSHTKDRGFLTWRWEFPGRGILEAGRSSTAFGSSFAGSVVWSSWIFQDYDKL